MIVMLIQCSAVQCNALKSLTEKNRYFCVRAMTFALRVSYSRNRNPVSNR
jgi:hypothetical protein